MKTTRSILLLFLCASCAGAADKKDPLSDAEAKTAIEQQWKSLAVLAIPVGKVAISHGLTEERNPAQRRFNQKDLSVFKAWQAAGLVQVRELKNLTKEFTGWDDWLKLTQGGVGSEIQILLTEQGRKANTSTNTDIAQIPQGSFRITKITSNEERERDFDRYCLVTGFHQAEWTAEFKQIMRQLNQPVPAESRKFRALFKFDKFANRWKLITSDNADAEGEFTSNTVQEALDAHR
jgi:hypothetical protein